MDCSDLMHENVPSDFLEFAQYCELLSDGRQMPREQDFNLTDVPWLFGRLYLIDVLDGGADYRFNNFGIFWQAIYGEDLTGRRLSYLEAASDSLHALRGHLDRIIQSRAPLVSVGRLVWPEHMIVFDRLSIPFSADEINVSKIVVAAHYDDYTEDMVFARGEGLPKLVLEEQRRRVLAKTS